MIAYVKGILTEKSEEGLVVEAAGVGYGIAVPTRLTAELETGEEVKIYTYFQVTEDAQKLYGFGSREEKALFQLLLKVSGIGPKLALSVLSAFAPDELKIAIVTGDAKGLSRAPGLGKKTAEKLILELKDKLDIADLAMSSQESGPSGANISGDAYSDAVAALIALGYASSEAMKAVRSVDAGPDVALEDVLQAALMKLSPF